MPICDICAKTLLPGEMRVEPASVIVSATRNGYVPSRIAAHSPMVAVFGLDMPGAEFWRDTVSRNQSADWGLCADCHLELERRIRKREEPRHETAAKKGSNERVSTAPSSSSPQAADDSHRLIELVSEGLGLSAKLRKAAPSAPTTTSAPRAEDDSHRLIEVVAETIALSAKLRQAAPSAPTAISVVCPKCGASQQCGPQWKRTKCPVCKETFSIPSAASGAVAPSSRPGTSYKTKSTDDPTEVGVPQNAEAKAELKNALSSMEQDAEKKSVISFFRRLFESNDAREERITKEAEARLIAENAENKRQTEEEERQSIARQAEAKRRAEEEESRRQRQRPCKKCGQVFEAVGGSPPNGGTCTHCGGIFCYGCMKSEFASQMERHPEKHDAYGVRRVQERSPLSSYAKSDALRQMMDMMQPETKVLSVADEVNGLPCPDCLSEIWKRSARPL